MTVSVILNSWKRQENLFKIVPALASSPLVTEIFIWDNNPEIYLDARQFNEPKLNVVNTNRDFGLSTRWVLGLFAKNSCIITQDDDHLVSPESIEKMYTEWKKNPDVMHGVAGRTVYPDGTYRHRMISQGKAPVICCGFAALDRSYCFAYPRALYLVTRDLGWEMRGYVDTAGDDMLMSYLVLSYSKKANLVHKIPHGIFPGYGNCDIAIHKRPLHIAKRTAMVRAFQKLFGVDSKKYE